MLACRPWTAAVTAIGLCAALGALGGCRTVIEVDGINVIESYWRGTTDELGTRTSFDIDCPPSAVQFQLIKRTGRYPSEVGVTGCGRRATYVRAVGRNVGPWVLNVYSGPQGLSHGGQAAGLPNEAGDLAVGSQARATGPGAASGYGGRVERVFDEERKMHAVRGEFSLGLDLTLSMIAAPAMSGQSIRFVLRARRGEEPLLSCKAIEVLVNAEPIGGGDNATAGAPPAVHIEGRFDHGVFAPLAQQHSTFGLRVCGKVLPFWPVQLAEVQKFLAIHAELMKQLPAQATSATAPATTPPPTAEPAQPDDAATARPAAVPPSTN